MIIIVCCTFVIGGVLILFGYLPGFYLLNRTRVLSAIFGVALIVLACVASTSIEPSVTSYRCSQKSAGNWECVEKP